MARLAVRLLGSPRVESDTGIANPGFRKALALLAYLAVTKRKQSRDVLAALLWPAQRNDQARASLRHAIYSIKKIGSNGWIDADRTTVALDPSQIWVDVDEFTAKIERCDEHHHADGEVCRGCHELLLEAVEIYRGDFLAGFGIKDCLDFDDWQFFQAQNFKQLYAKALEKLSRCWAAASDLVSAANSTRRWLLVDPFNESAHRQLMLIHSWQGNRAAAVRHYEQFVVSLRDELGVVPQRMTRDLVEAISDDRVPAPPKMAENSETQSAAPQLVLSKTRYVTVVAVRTLGVEERSQTAVATTVRQFGGSIDAYDSNRVVAAFGRDQTRESDAELAVLAALDLARGSGSSPAPSVGVATGWVECDVAEIPHGHAGQVGGSVVAIAARLSDLAASGEVIADDTTRRHVRHSFSISLVDGGADTGLVCCRVESRLRSPEKSRGIEGLRARLVGRTEAIAQLDAVLDRWRSGAGWLVTITGEAGIGKTRISAETVEHAVGRDQTVLCLKGRCVASARPVSYWPFVEVVRSYVGIDDRDDRDEIVRKVREALRRLNLPDEESASAYIAHLFSLPLDSLSPGDLAQKSPEQIKEQTLLSLRLMIEQIGRRQKLVLVLEDLHWSDDLSMDLVNLLTESLASSSILLFCLFRPDADHRVAQLTTIAQRRCAERYTGIHLGPLSRDECNEMVHSLLEGQEVHESLVENIAVRSEGNPFFIEEIIRTLVAQGTLAGEPGRWRLDGEISAGEVPDTIHRLVSSRLDTLSDDARMFLRRAAVVGRIFRRRLLSGDNDGSLEAGIRECTSGGLIYEERSVPEVEFAFLHAFTHEATYQSIPEPMRETEHLNVAQRIEELYEDRLEEWYEALAYHYTRTSEILTALDYIVRSTKKAMTAFANESALEHLDTGLSLLPQVPDPHLRDEAELELQVLRGGVLAVTTNYTAPDVRHAWERVRDLCGRSRVTPQSFEALHGLLSYYLVAGDYHTAHDLGNLQLDYAGELGKSEFALEAHLGLGVCDIYLGDLESAISGVHKTLDLYDQESHRHLAFLYGHDPAMAGSCQMALAYWLRGEVEQARNWITWSESHSRALEHWPSLCFALSYVAIVTQCLGEFERSQVAAGEAIELGTRYGLPLWQLLGTMLLQWNLVVVEKKAENIDLLAGTVDAYLAAGPQLLGTYFLYLVADASGKIGRPQDGLSYIDRAFTLVTKNDERLWEAELYRLKGELTETTGGTDSEVEGYYRSAIERSRRMGAASLELRAAASLARHLKGDD